MVVCAMVIYQNYNRKKILGGIMEFLTTIGLFITCTYVFVKLQIIAQQTQNQEKTFTAIRKNMIRNIHYYWNNKNG